MITYEERLGQDLMKAFMQASMHFEERSAVFHTLWKITGRLEELKIPYAVVGGIAMFFHGFRRFTEDVDLLVTAEGLKRIREELRRDYVPSLVGSKHLRDVENGVRIEFVVTGQFPGDGKPKAVAFPDPATVCVKLKGVHVAL